MKAPTIFYSWQSDTNRDWNEKLIGACLEKAAAKSTGQLGLQAGVVVERDATGVGGLPSIPETIFERIDSCAVFVGDMTLVGQAWPYKKEHNPEETQKFPNANVILELGYAVKAIGWKRVLGVMNCTYGQPDKQIFHLLQHRWQLKYELKEKSKFSDAESYLTEKLSEYISCALLEQHAEATRVLQRLNIECLQLLAIVKRTEYFSHDSVKQIADENVAAQFNQIFSTATNRLLDLGVIFTHHDSASSTYAYHWTYVGQLVRERI
jgi:hypothetical protein